jgi:hypothetical protein
MQAQQRQQIALARLEKKQKNAFFSRGGAVSAFKTWCLNDQTIIACPGGRHGKPVRRAETD